MEYAWRSLDPRDSRGDDVNFYLTGLAIPGEAERLAAFATSQSMLYSGVRDGVLYRQAIMRKPPNNGVGYIIDLAEITIPGGVIRVDRSRMAFEHELRLGHFGLPHEGGSPAEVRAWADGDRRLATARIRGRKLAFIAYRGWDEVCSRVHAGFNAEADESTVLYARRRRTTKNPPMELMISVLLHGRDDEPWTEEELDPIADLEILDVMASGSVLGARLTLATGEEFVVDFKDIDGMRSC
jgi:hypothetical protein